MINIIWFFILAIGLIVALLTGQGATISQVIIKSSDSPVQLIISMIGIMCLWCGVMKIANESGLTDKLAKLLRPLLRLLFKRAGKDEKALGAIVMNLTANMMGLSNAATPFGIKAMEEMQMLNPDKDRASDDMCLFLVLNAACLQLVPSTIISVRAASGSQNPAIILIPAIIATSVSAVVGVVVCKILQRFF